MLILTNLTHYQMTNFRFFQTKRVCRRQFHIWRKWQKAIQTGGKHCGKRRNCSLRAISPLPIVFSKGLFTRGFKRCCCVGLGYDISVLTQTWILFLMITSSFFSFQTWPVSLVVSVTDSWLWFGVQYPVELKFLCGNFLPLTSEICEKSSQWF